MYICDLSLLGMLFFLKKNEREIYREREREKKKRMRIMH